MILKKTIKQRFTPSKDSTFFEMHSTGYGGLFMNETSILVFNVNKL